MKTLNFSNQLGTTTILEINNNRVGCIETKGNRFIIPLTKEGETYNGNFDSLEGAKNDVIGFSTSTCNSNRMQLNITNN